MNTLALSGPLETGDFPDQLTARVVTPGAAPRLHGYDVETDLSLHYGMADLVLLSFTGELPSDSVRAAFEVACMFLLPVSVADTGPHSAVLARLCGATSASIFGVAAIGLAEQARVMMSNHMELLTWLKSHEGHLPSRYQTQDTDDSVERLRTAIARTGLVVQALDHRPTRDAALICVLYACGLKRSDHLQALIALFRLPCALAEGFAERATHFAKYPINLPPFIYEE